MVNMVKELQAIETRVNRAGSSPSLRQKFQSGWAQLGSVTKSKYKPHMFAGPLNPGADLIVEYFNKCLRWWFES